MCDISKIKNYILYLKKECGLLVTLHVDGIDNVIIPSELRLFNIHDNSYCTYIKKNADAHSHCVKKQKDIIKKCNGGSFCGTCYAGDREYIYPNKKDGKPIAFISVGGYSCENSASYISNISKKYGICENELLNVYKTLKSEQPNKEFIDTLIYPLQCMIELAYIEATKEDDRKITFAEELINYIKKNHNRDISSKDICKHFYCSRSKVSHVFNDAVGISIKRYTNNLRIEDAKELLRNSELSVTEIGFSVGFKDSNYFTETFKKTVGVTPSVFRKLKD